MSQENVELVMSLYDAVQGRDYESPFQLLDQNIVWDMSRFGLPDAARVYRGHEGVREFWSAWLAAWETIKFEARAVDDQGDHVIVEVHQHNRGRTSRVMLDFRYFQVFVVRNGKVTACCVGETRAEVLKAVGLAE
jgi:ketosteroid isomerase-like protein